MAGTNANFNADEFRTAVQAAMLMGQPTDVDQQVTFVWTEQDTYSPEGPDDDPYSWSETPTAVLAPAKTFVQVNCAVEYVAGAVDADGMGGFDASKAVLTILDVDYVNVIGADRVVLGGNTYVIDPPGPVPIGLFQVTVFQYHLSALT